MRSLTIAAGCLPALVVALGGCAYHRKPVGTLCQTDPIFHQPAPLLFAHRGGAKEMPESTALAFRYARDEAFADVLEMDVQLTHDHQFVVWHGPALDNVRIQGQPDDPAQRQRRDIGEYEWCELAGKAWVADPTCDGTPPDLARVPPECERQLMRLVDFLQAFPCRPLNIEIKDYHVTDEDVQNFFAILVHAPSCKSGEQRTIVVASAWPSVLRKFHAVAGNTYATNQPWPNVIGAAFGWLPAESLRGRALQTSYSCFLSGDRVVRRVRSASGAVHVFITPFLGIIPGLDTKMCQLRQPDIDELLQRGVTGIMTDRPCEVRAKIDAWLRKKGRAVPKRPLKCVERLVHRCHCSAWCLKGAVPCPTP